MCDRAKGFANVLADLALPDKKGLEPPVIAPIAVATQIEMSQLLHLGKKPTGILT